MMCFIRSVRQLPRTVFRAQQGAGFIEVLVALVILAVGLLGVMSMQARGLNSNQRALFATEANLLAYDMADRIVSFGGDRAIAGEYGGLTTVGNAALGNVIANNDRNAWQTEFINSSLPSGQGIITWDGSVYTITIRWDEERTGAVGLTCGNVDTDALGQLINLRCYTLVVTP